MAGGAALALDFSLLENQLLSRFGPARVNLLRDWQQLLNSGASEQEKLKLVNSFFNRNIQFDDDQNIWNQSDYWATPLETIGKGRGDCEDFALAKYYSLLHMGIPMNRLRLIYVKARQGNLQQAHMVLAYYPQPNATPLVLDNLDPSIKNASQRPDLTPVFSFNGEGLWQGTGNKAANSKFSRWQELQMRARSEGHR
ncbi:transglutaminase-like cysteine peptidase [Azovibrio restrictus]|uniref:transglutaminase-like cysteine peptidase n=1 Tax=Azovibrio restrictus TaxID=146938 RepID=UPI0026EA7B5C|nr:transglutaminase-like cysteine peptidase [Azovibrio restrictus]MDD3481877.1 transglutaminase-like cysteine peptidase [Azovibrio restrictus]